MIETAARINDRQFERELEKQGKQTKPWVKKKPTPAKDNYSLVPMEIDVAEPRKKETRKCYNCQKVGHLAVNCRSKKKNKEGKGKQLNTTSAWKGREMEEPQRAPQGTLPHNHPEAALLREEDNLRQHTEKLENMLQETLDRLDKV